jgi:hypothetical protein
MDEVDIAADGSGGAVVLGIGYTPLASPSNYVSQLFWLSSAGVITGSSQLYDTDNNLTHLLECTRTRLVVQSDEPRFYFIHGQFVFADFNEYRSNGEDGIIYASNADTSDAKGFFVAEIQNAEIEVRRYDFIFSNAPPNIVESQFGVSNGNLVVCWPGELGETYTIQKSPDLLSWTNQTFGLTGTGTNMYFQDLFTVNTSAFYRVLQD